MHQKYEEMKKTFLKDLKIPYIIKNDISKYIISETNSAYYTVYDKIISMNEMTEFQFLYSNYSLSDLSFSLLENITQKLIDQTIENVTNIYNKD